MSNLLLGWPNRLYRATLSGGNWLSALPLANLQNGDAAEPARSADLNPASTVIDIDLHQAYSLRALAVDHHNLSLTARLRVRLGSAPGLGDIYAGAYEPAWMLTFDNPLLEWEDPSWWLGTGDAEYRGHPYLSPVILPAWYTARHVRIEIDDPDNPDGYVDVGRLFVGGGYVPEVNHSWGIKYGLKDYAIRSTTPNGTRFNSPGRRERNVQFSLDWMSDAEAGTVYELMRRLGTVEEVLCLPDLSDLPRCQRFGFIGTLSELSDIAHPRFNNNSVNMQIEEWL